MTLANLKGACQQDGILVNCLIKLLYLCIENSIIIKEWIIK